MEIMKLIGQNVGVRDEIKLFSAEALLHLHIIVAKSVFPGDFVALREMIYPLILVETFVEIALTRARCPEKVPFMRLRVLKVIVLKKGAHKFGFAFQYFVEHLLIVDVVASLGPALQGRALQLLLRDRFNLLDRVERVMRRAPEIVMHALFFVLLSALAFHDGSLSTVVKVRPRSGGWPGITVIRD